MEAAQGRWCLGLVWLNSNGLSCWLWSQAQKLFLSGFDKTHLQWQTNLVPQAQLYHTTIGALGTALSLSPCVSLHRLPPLSEVQSHLENEHHNIYL